jgi:preprotein translocase subunit SecE
MGREQRRAQERAQRRQQGQRRQQRTAPQVSTASASETPRKGSFFKPRWVMDIASELRKVTWPNRREVGNLTVVVIVVALILGAVLGTADLAFGWFVEQTILR